MNDLFASDADALIKEMAQQFSVSSLEDIASAADAFAEAAANLSGFAGLNAGDAFRQLADSCRKVVALGRAE